MIRINLSSVFFSMKHEIPFLVAPGSSAIVNTAVRSVASSSSGSRPSRSASIWSRVSPASVGHPLVGGDLERGLGVVGDLDDDDLGDPRGEGQLKRRTVPNSGWVSPMSGAGSQARSGPAIRSPSSYHAARPCLSGLVDAPLLRAKAFRDQRWQPLPADALA